MKQKWNKILAGSGLLAAIGASVCCIGPVLAIIAGVGGLGASFSWLEPIRPYLIGFTAVVLAAAWYIKLKPAKSEANQECEDCEPQSFWQSRLFLGIVTVFSVLALAFPYLSAGWAAESHRVVREINKENATQVTLKIQGMTCTACEQHVNEALVDVPGVGQVQSSYEEGEAVVVYDTKMTEAKELAAKAEKKTGYTVKKIKEKR